MTKIDPMLQITETITLDENELSFDFVRASGPGGQNVNKVATAVQLRFDAGNSPSLPATVRERLKKLAGKRVTCDGILIIEARRFRSQEKNRRDAIARLLNLIKKAADIPKPRIETKPTRQSQKRRLQEKKRRSEIKKRRSKPEGFED